MTVEDNTLPLTGNASVEALMGQMGVQVPPMQIPQLGPELAPVIGPPNPEARFAATSVVEPPKMSVKEQRELITDATVTRAIPHTLRRFGALANLVPGGDRVRIRKRADGGQLALVNDYMIRDIQSSGDIESFVDKYIKPDYGGGEYQISIIDSKGGEYFVGNCNLIASARTPGGNDAATTALSKSLEMIKEAYSRPAPAPPDPMETFMKTKEIMENLKGGSTDPMLMMMMQQHAQQASMMQALLAPRTDDRLLAAIEGIARRVEAIEKAPPPLPMMSPPAPPTDYVAMATAAAAIIGALAPVFKREPDIRPMELVSMVTGAQQAAAAAAAQAASADKVTTRELLELMRNDKERERPQQTIVEQIEAIARVKDGLAQLSPPPGPQGPQGTNFWDALVTLFQSNDFAAAIGKGVGDSLRRRAATQQEQPQHVNVHTIPPQPAPIANIAANNAPPPAAEPVPPPLPLPGNFRSLCAAIDAAENDEVRSMAVVNALQSLYLIPDWHPFLNAMMEFIAVGDRPRALGNLSNWLDMLVKGQLLRPSSATASLKMFHEHWDVIRSIALARADAELKQKAAEADARAASAPAAPAPAPANGPGDAEDEGEDDTDDEDEGDSATGPAPADVELPPEYGGGDDDPNAI